MVIPIVGATPSSIQMMERLHLMDTLIGLWLRSLTFTGTSYLIFYAAFKMLPWAYAESAFIDGASHVTVMFRIMLPLVLNTIGVMFLITFVGLWNDYQTPMIYWNDYPTISVGLFGFMLDPTHSSVPLKIGCCMVTVVPILLLFLLMRKKMMGNLTIGGLKG
jgi:raffinose/stachyose/melibiose transport system permease protein/N-acetylglucosamine transport system permease protein